MLHWCPLCLSKDPIQDIQPSCLLCLLPPVWVNPSAFPCFFMALTCLKNTGCVLSKIPPFFLGCCFLTIGFVLWAYGKNVLKVPFSSKKKFDSILILIFYRWLDFFFLLVGISWFQVMFLRMSLYIHRARSSVNFFDMTVFLNCQKISFIYLIFSILLYTHLILFMAAFIICLHILSLELLLFLSKLVSRITY